MHSKVFAGLKPVDGILFEELIRCGRSMLPYPGHGIMAKKIGCKSEAAVAAAIDRLETARLINRDRAGRRTCAFIICASGRRIDFAGGTVPPRRSPVRGWPHA